MPDVDPTLHAARTGRKLELARVVAQLGVWRERQTTSPLPSSHRYAQCIKRIKQNKQFLSDQEGADQASAREYRNTAEHWHSSLSCAV